MLSNHTNNTSIQLTQNKKHSIVSVLQSQVGVRQGDSIASFCFAIGIQSTYEALQRQCPNVKLIAIHDDLTMIGPSNETLRALDIFDSLLKARKD